MYLSELTFFRYPAFYSFPLFASPELKDKVVLKTSANNVNFSLRRWWIKKALPKNKDGL